MAPNRQIGWSQEEILLSTILNQIERLTTVISGGGSGTVTSVSGTANRITSTGGISPVIDIAATYVGQASITTLGTVTTGTWNADVISSSKGGAGSVSGILKANGSGVVSAAVAGTDYLAPNGSGAALTGVYLLASGGTASAANTFTANTAAWFNWNGTWTATANNQAHTNFGGSFTSRNTAADVMHGYLFNPTLTQNAGLPASQIFSAVAIKPTFSVTTALSYALELNANMLFSGATAKLIKINGATNLLDINVGTNSWSLLNAAGCGITNSTTDLQLNSQSTISLRSQAAISNIFFFGDQSQSATTARVFAVIRGPVPSVATAYTPTSGTSVMYQLGNGATGNGNADFQPSSGTATHTSLKITERINQTGSATGAITWLDIDPSVTSITGIEYGILQRRATALSGFGVATPVSTLDTDGSIGMDITSTSTDITLNATHCTVLVDASGAARTITLPAASGCTRRIYTIKKTDNSANVVTIDGNASETIDGATTQPLNTQWEYLKIQCNGTAWFIIGND